MTTTKMSSINTNKNSFFSLLKKRNKTYIITIFFDNLSMALIVVIFFILYCHMKLPVIFKKWKSFNGAGNIDLIIVKFCNDKKR